MGKYTEYIIAALLIVMVTFVGFRAQPNINVDVDVDGGTPGISSGIGALGDPNPRNLDTDEWTAFNDVVVDDLEVNDDAFILGDLSTSGDFNVTDSLQYGGVENDWIEGTCADATTTLFAVINPWGADAFVDKVIIELTNGTSSLTFDVGTSSSAYGNVAAPSEAFVDDLSVATSTVIKTINDNGTLSAVYGFTDPGTNSQPYALWGSGQYISAVATALYGVDMITPSYNTFSCTYKIHSFK